MNIGSVARWRHTQPRVIVVVCTLSVDGFPRRRKPLIKPDLFPDLETFFTAEGASFDETVDATVNETVCVTGIIESREVGLDLEMGGERERWELADVCSRWTSSSRSKFSAIGIDMFECFVYQTTNKFLIGVHSKRLRYFRN